VSTNSRYNIEDVVSQENLQALGEPDQRQIHPEAEIIESGDFTAVTTAGSSIAASIPRLSLGEMDRSRYKLLEGFHGEFADHSENIVFVDESLKNILGDQAIATTENIDNTYAVSVRGPEDALEVVEKYQDQYGGSIEQDFINDIESRRAAIPVLYDKGVLAPEMGITIIDAEEEVIQGDIGLTGDELLEEEESLSANNLSESDVLKYPAPEESRAERCIEILLPQGYDEVDYWHDRRNLVVNVDGNPEFEESLNVGDSVLGYEENNGFYRLEIG